MRLIAPRPHLRQNPSPTPENDDWGVLTLADAGERAIFL